MNMPYVEKDLISQTNSNGSSLSWIYEFIELTYKQPLNPPPPQTHMRIDKFEHTSI